MPFIFLYIKINLVLHSAKHCIYLQWAFHYFWFICNFYIIQVPQLKTPRVCTYIVIDHRRSSQTSSCILGTELKQSIENRTLIKRYRNISEFMTKINIQIPILHDIVLLKELLILIGIVRRDSIQKLNVVVRMKATHVFKCGWSWFEHLHAFIETIIHHKRVGKRKTMRFHRMSMSIIVFANRNVE